MNIEKFSEAMGEIDSKYIEKSANYHFRQKKHGWIKWASMAACLAAAAAIGMLIPRQTTDPALPEQDSEVMLELAISNLNIYYLSESGTIESKNMEVRCTPEDILNEWARLNNIQDVTFVNCVYDDGGSKNGDLLIQSLRQTFCDYIPFDDFNLIVDD